MGKSNVVQIQRTIRNQILDQARALGNSKRGFKEVASDLCNQFDRKKGAKVIAEGCFLSATTVRRVKDCDSDYRPQADTLERVFKFFGAEVSFNEVTISGRYRNKEK